MANTPHVDFSIVHAVPGLGLPLDYVPTEDDQLYVGEPLPTALLEEGYQSTNFSETGRALLPITTSRELFMLQFMNEITDKYEWFRKVFDPEIVAKWQEESKRDASVANEGGFIADFEMTQKMFDHCIAELQYKAKNVYPTRSDGAIVVFNGNVVKADKAVPESIKVALQDAVKSLESVPDKDRDWHPDSDEMVLDLVHPSLFPLIYGKTRVLAVGEKVVGLEDCVRRCGEGEVIPVTTEVPAANKGYGRSNMPEPYSLKFQWLPCEVDISRNDGARITSYINNLSPTKHTEIYRVVEQVIDAAIPLWELTLAPLYDPDFEYSQRIICDTVLYEDEEEEETPTTEGETSGNSGPLGGVDEGQGQANIEDDDSGDEMGDDDEDSEREPRSVPIKPEPEVFDAQKLSSPKAINFKQLYGESRRPLQIIVKLANIELTPDKPKYGGGSWHVEGKQNEHICATALYYYSSHNIKASHLAFIQFVDSDSVEEFPYEQDHHEFLTEIFGCENGQEGSQLVGRVDTREGRLLTFPNILQHQVQPFELEDPSQPGHRKILALFLVDPNVRIISTANVPCQQLDWWREETAGGPQGLDIVGARGLDGLPVELKDQIYGLVDGFPIALNEAKELRLELMEERKKFVVAHQDRVQALNSFSLCEH